MSISKKRIALVLAVLNLVSVFIFCAGVEAASSVIASYDMNTSYSQSGNTYIKEASSNGMDLWVPDTAGFALANVNSNTTYSNQKAAYVNNAHYIVQNAEPLLNTLDTAFTYEVWLKLPADLDGNTHGILNVGNSPNHSAINEMTVLKNEQGLGSLVYRRFFEQGQNYWEIGQKLTLNQWHHIVLSYDSVSPNNDPIILIDGTKSDMTKAIANASGAAMMHDSTNNEAAIGWKTLDTASSLPKTYFGKATFYSGCFTEAEAIESYNQSVSNYEPEFNVQIKDVFNNVVPQENLYSMYPQGNKIEIDFTGADKYTVTNDSVYIADITSNSWINYTGTWSDNKYILSDISLTNGDLYKLTINGVKDTNGQPIRSAAQELTFIPQTNSSLVALAKYENLQNVQNFVQQPYGKTGTIVNSMDNSNYQLTLEAYDSTVKVQNVTYGDNYALRANNSAYMVGSTQGLAQQLNGAFTYETWVKVNSVTDWRGIFGIGVPSNDDHTNLWLGSDGSLTFVRKFDTRQGYWFTAGGVFPIGQYNHLIVSYDPSSVNNVPEIYVNGKRITGLTTATSPSGTAATASANAIVTLCGTVYQRGTRKLAADFSTATIYTGKATTYEVIDKYNSTKALYETPYEVKIYDANNTMYEKTQLNSVSNTGTMTIDLSGVDSSTISGNIYAVNKATNQATQLSGTLSGSLYTIPLSSLQPADYILTVDKGILNTSLNAIRTTAYTLDFSIINSLINVLNVNLYDESNQVIPDTITAPVNAKAKATVKNNTEISVNATIYMAIYDGNKLVSVKAGTKPVLADKTEYAVETSDYITIDQNSVIKVMLWNDKQEPLFEGLTK